MTSSALSPQPLTADTHPLIVGTFTIRTKTTVLAEVVGIQATGEWVNANPRAGMAVVLPNESMMPSGNFLRWANSTMGALKRTGLIK
jgi:hypothetical protein